MRKKFSKSLLIFSLFLIIPIISTIASQLILNDINKDFYQQLSSVAAEDGYEIKQDVTAVAICQGRFGQGIKEDLNDLCQEINPIIQVKSLSITTVVIALCTIFIITLLGTLARINSHFLLWSLRFGMIITVLSSAFLVLVQCCLLAYTLYITESYYTGYIHPKLILVIGLIGTIAALNIIKSVWDAFKFEDFVRGISVDKNEQKRIWELAEETAQAVGTQKPDNIILGLGNNYFVTETKINCYSGEMKGRTLFISLSLLSLLSPTELKAIIGHELAHFKGQDTIYSRKISPSFLVLYNGLNNLAGLNSVLVFPVLALIRFLTDIFDISKAKYDRAQETRADKIGASITTPLIFAQALAKIHFYGIFWNQVEIDCYNAILEGQYITNKDSLLKSYIQQHNPDNQTIRQELLKDKTSAPNDSHPSLIQRMDNLNVSIDSLNLSSTIESTSDNLITNIEDIENDLSLLEQKLLYDRIHGTNNNKGKEQQK